jgi:hypothetical protein
LFLIALFALPALGVAAGMMYLTQKYAGVKIYKSAFEYELGYANQGLMRSQLYVADAYDRGFQVAQNKPEAVKWYRKAAERRSTKAMYQLGEHLIAGDGASKDAAEGFVWIQRAAFVEYPPAEYRMTSLLCQGIGTTVNCPKGLDYLKKSAQEYYVPAMRELAMRQTIGDGVARDLVSAYVWHAVAFDVEHNGRTQKLPPDPQMLAVAAQLTPDQLAKAKARFAATKPARDAKAYRARLF